MGRQSALIIVQNLPVPLDRRVWMECQALRDAKYDVAVICPKSPGDSSFQKIDGISLYKYRAAPATHGLISYILEFVYCWLRTALLSVKVYRRHRFSVMQACNPPDTYWLLAWFWRVFGVKYIFDQHDLNPELFRSRFGDPTSLLGRSQLAALYWLERMTYRTAGHVIVTNDSYRKTALARGGMPLQNVSVVRSGPDTSTMKPVPPRPELRRGARHLLAYVGIMGPQDNVDVLLTMMNILVRELGRRDVHLVLMGFGDCLNRLRQQSEELDLTEFVTFTGRADQTMIADHLSTAAIGLAPDLKTPLNDISTHNKTMEYMAFALPIVSFDLTESRRSAGDSSVYVSSGDIHGFAEAVYDLLEDPERRARMGKAARKRCVEELDWKPQSRRYVLAFDRTIGRVPNLPKTPVHLAEGRVSATMSREAK